MLTQAALSEPTTNSGDRPFSRVRDSSVTVAMAEPPSLTWPENESNGLVVLAFS